MYGKTPNYRVSMEFDQNHRSKRITAEFCAKMLTSGTVLVRSTAFRALGMKSKLLCVTVHVDRKQRNFERSVVFRRSARCCSSRRF